MIVKLPRTNPIFMGLALVVALFMAYLIVNLVFAFGWFAGGLAMEKADEQRRLEAPIDIKFQDGPPPADTNTPATDPNQVD